MLLQDEWVLSLITSVKKQAEKILKNESPADQEELEMQLRFWFSKKYNIPMKSPMLDAYTFPEMLLEFYLHTYKPPEVEDIISETKDELADMIAQEFSEEENGFLDDVFGKKHDWEFKEEV